jgi:hypothetical protein
MKILVAGGAGYIGSRLVPKLVERGYDVDVIDLFWFGNHLPEDAGAIEKDVFDLTEDDLKDYEQVIFLAGLSQPELHLQRCGSGLSGLHRQAIRHPAVRLRGELFGLRLHGQRALRRDISGELWLSIWYLQVAR